MQPDAVNRADPNRSRDDRSDLAQPVLELQEPPHDFLARRVENLSSGRRFDSGSSAFYQSAVILFLKAANLLADRRLGNKVL